ncbi:MAG: exodeoxyribonuclease V subunit gamma, partial [Muribaculaceae bacterium]|nr:exodeoxyribonuclease V subunit gamma [Muribaculaceae bacterium]
YSEYSRLMSEGGYKDGEGDVAEAAKRAAKYGYFKGKTVFADAFKSFTADEIALLEAVIADSESFTVCLTTADREPRNYSVFDTVNKTVSTFARLAAEHGVAVNKIFMDVQHRFKAAELAFYSENVLRNRRKRFEGDCRALRVYRSEDGYGEGDFVCSEIRRLAAEEGYRYGDIVVMARRKELYGSIMESGFERYGIPFYTDENGSAAHKSLFIFVRTALALAADENASSEDWLRYMKTGMLGLTEEEIAAVESYCYKWSVEGKMWGEKFPYDDAELGAESVRERVCAPVENLRKSCKNTVGKEICAALLKFFDEVRVTKNIEEIYENCNTEDAAALESVREIKQLWDGLCGLLETLNRALGETSVTLGEFAEIFSSAVRNIKLSAPPQTLDCVRFVAAHTARVSEPKAVFIIGANEGSFPCAEKPSGLFSDRDRLALENAGMPLSGGAQEKIAEERFVTYSALSAASERLYITYALSDVTGRALYPSVAVNQAVEMFGEDAAETFEKRGVIPFCATPEAAYYQYVQNYRRNDAASASLLAALKEIPEYAERIKYLRDIEFSAGHALSNEAGKRLFGRSVHLSASRFEDYRKCPFMYYCKKGLDLYPPRKIELDRPSRGNAVHGCLCGILREFDKNALVKMSRAEIESAVKKHLKAYYESDAVGGDYGKTRRFKAAFSRLAGTVSDIVERLAAEFAQSEFAPADFEYTLRRTDGDEEPLRLITPSGINVYFSGAVDRVDIFERDGKKYVRVVDYKSGIKELKYGDLLYGVNMQMLLYLFALTDSGHKGRYSGDVPAGVLYMPARDAAPALDRYGGEEDRVKALKDTYKMSGLVLSDDLVITAMERDCGGEFIPVKRTKNGYSAYSKLIGGRELENLRKYSYQLLEETAESLHRGKIAADPLADEKGGLPCGYCDYSGVCGNYPPERYREYAENAEGKILEIIANKTADDNKEGGDGDERLD